jgi:hypothetical protein
MDLNNWLIDKSALARLAKSTGQKVEKLKL